MLGVMYIVDGWVAGVGAGNGMKMTKRIDVTVSMSSTIEDNRRDFGTILSTTSCHLGTTCLFRVPT